MTRENSSCKWTALLGRCCRRQAALIALSFLALLVSMPVYLILRIRSYERSIQGMADLYRMGVVRMVQQELCGGLPASLVLAGLAILAGIAMFRYLHVRQQTDFFHALPVRRETLFAVRVLTGLIAVIPAYLINFVLSCVIATACGYADALDGGLLAISVLTRLCGFVLVYAVSIAAAMLCGNTLVSVAACAALQFGPMLTYLEVDWMLAILYPARADSIGAHAPLSPPIDLVRSAGELCYALYNDALWDETVRGCAIKAVCCLIAAVVVFAISCALYRIRRSENTGLAIVFPVIELPVKLWMVSGVALGCGLVFENMTSNWSIMFLGMALGALVTACVMEIILDLDFRSLFRRWRSTLVYAAICAVLLGCMAFDVTGWNSKLPDRADIVSAELTGGMEEWNCSAKYSPLGWSEEQDSQELPSAQRLTSEAVIDAIYDSAQYGAQRMQGDRSTIRDDCFYGVTFTLADGKQFSRSYYAPYPEGDGDLSANNPDYKRLTDNASAVRFSEEFLSRRSAAAIAYDSRENAAMLIPVNYLTAEGKITRDSCIETPQHIDKVLETLYREAQQLTADYVSEHAPVAVLRVLTQETADRVFASGNTVRALDDPTVDYDTEEQMVMYGDYAGSNPAGKYMDIPLYACEEQTLGLLGQYSQGFEPGFASQTITNISITTYRDGMETSSETLHADDEIAATLPKLVPYVLLTYIDPLYLFDSGDAYVSIASGQIINCSLRYDKDSSNGATKTADKEHVVRAVG